MAVLEAGDRPDLQQLSESFGAAAEWLLLCDLFQMHAAASKYWIDGLMADVVLISTRRVVVIKGRAWCADHRTQWQVPAEFTCTFSDAEPAGLLSMRIGIGNAAFWTLSEHCDRNITRREPQEWLLEFQIAGITADGKAGVEVHHAGGADESHRQ